MRSMWKGAISFGLVSIPIQLYTATENKNVQLRQVHAADGGRIKYKRVCSIDGEEVPYSDIAKGYEAGDGQMVVRKLMTVTLSGDHRVIDGAIGAEYLRELKALLEHPMRLLF